MKITKSVITMVLASITLTSFASSTEDWVQTPFWTAPTPKMVYARLKSNYSAERACYQFKKLLYTPEGEYSSVATDPQKFNRFRQSNDSFDFPLEFSDGRIEIEVKAFGKAPKGTLPHSVKNRAVTSVDLEEATKFEASFLKSSFTRLAKGLGLEASDFTVTKNAQGKLVVRTKGIDFACDLLNAGVSIKTTAPADVYLLEGDSKNLYHFYNNLLAPSIRDVVKSKESLTQRAARIGYRTGKILEEEFPGIESKESETQVMGIMKTLFNENTLAPSKHLVEVNKELMIHIDSGVRIKEITVILEL